MRKVKLQMQMSIDGFVAGPDGEMDWMSWNWGDDINKYVTNLTTPVDTILLGRNMAGGFISHWKEITKNPDDPQYPFARIMYDTPKVIFSKTLSKSDPVLNEWDNSILATKNISKEMEQLKAQPGKDIIVYGGANFVSNLIRYNLIDEYHLFINPAVLGSGKTIFKEREERLNLKLIAATAFSCGIVVFCYHPAQ